jgi:hypothetical protein
MSELEILRAENETLKKRNDRLEELVVLQATRWGKLKVFIEDNRISFPELQLHSQQGSPLD